MIEKKPPTFYKLGPGAILSGILECQQPATITGEGDKLVYILRPKNGAARVAIESCGELDRKLASFTGRLVTIACPPDDGVQRISPLRVQAGDRFIVTKGDGFRGWSRK